MQLINAAYAVLTTAELKRAYDASLRRVLGEEAPRAVGVWERLVAWGALAAVRYSKLA